jgi:hypothetical protein
MKERIIGSLLVIIVLAVLYFITGGDLGSHDSPAPQVTQPQTKFNF